MMIKWFLNSCFLLVPTLALSSDIFGTFRLESNRADPANITIITKAQIRGLGDNVDLAEVFRLVPGMQVTYLTDSDPVVSYHGTNLGLNRRMQIMIDGVSVFAAGLPLVKFEALPIDSVLDIERIEVIRGSAPSQYGNNSFLGTINIITTNSALAESDIAVRTSMSERKQSVAARANIIKNRNSLNLTVRQTQWDYFKDDIDKDNESKVLRLRYDYDDEHNIANFWYGKTIGDYKPDSVPVISDSRTHSGFDYDIASFRYSRKEDAFAFDVAAQKMTMEWDTPFEQCYPTLFVEPTFGELHNVNPSLATAVASGQEIDVAQLSMREIEALLRFNSTAQDLGAELMSDTCGIANIDGYAKRRTFDTYLSVNAGESNEIILGLTVESQTILSNWFFHDMGNLNSSLKRFYLTDKASVSDNFELQLSVAKEYHSETAQNSLDQKIAGFSYRISKDLYFKGTYANKHRSPSLIETHSNWVQNITNTSGPLEIPSSEVLTFFAASEGVRNLLSERLIEKTVSLTQASHSYDLSITLFYNELFNLISEDYLPGGEYHPSNDGYITQKGLELDYTKRFEQSDLRFHYSYQSLSDISGAERSMTPEHTFGAELSNKLSGKITLNVNAFYNSEYGDIDTEYTGFIEGQDFLSVGLNLRYKTILFDNEISSSIGLNHVRGDEYIGLPSNHFKQRNNLWIGVYYAF